MQVSYRQFAGGYDILRKKATLAQLVERLIRNQQVAGSIPAGGSISFNDLAVY
jgi:hypothetical protein